MGGNGIEVAKKYCERLLASITELQSRAAEQLKDPDVVLNVWRAFPDITAGLIAPYGTRFFGKINEETCLKLKKASYFAAKAVLEVCFVEVSRIRNIYKDDPTVLKDVEPKLEDVEKSYVKFKKFLEDPKNGRYLEGTTDVEVVFALSDDARQVEGLLNTYESLISSAIERKKEDRRTAKAGAKTFPFILCLISILSLVATVVFHFAKADKGGAMPRQEDGQASMLDEEHCSATNEPSARCKEKDAGSQKQTGVSVDKQNVQDVERGGEDGNAKTLLH